MTHTTWLSACLVAAAGVVVLGPSFPIAASPADAVQSAPSDRTATVEFRSSADLVPLNVVVTANDQKFVHHLKPSDFVVLEDGVPQTLSHFAVTDVPLDLAILLDTSGSMTGQMRAVQEAARGFVRAVRGIDRVMVVAVKRTTTVLHPLTGDVSGALAAIELAEAGGGTGLYNALYLTLKELARPAQGARVLVRRKAIVVLSDALDTTSLLSFEDVMDVARGAGVAAYTINLRSSAVSAGEEGLSRVLSRGEYDMKLLARETGARAFFPNQIADIAGIYGSIATELGSQYSMAYTPSNGDRDGKFRRISVAVADRPDMRARTRSGYQAPRPLRAGT
jgi:VWFA-related protein